MIVIKLWGGLCNQMFQYAFGYALSEIYDEEVYFETEYFSEQRKGVGKRKVVIDKYFDLSKFERIERPKNVEIFENRYINRIVREVASGKKLPCGKNYVFYKEPYRKYQEKIPYDSRKNNYYDGYWLTSKYFSKYQKEIRKEFELEAKYLEIVNDKMAKAKQEQSVAIHVRRGDYLNKNKANAPGGFDENKLVVYYKNAIEFIKGKIDTPVFYVFSDDIEWCRKNISVPGSKVETIENKNERADLLDLFCISECKHGIMSPSTFSWWGNWLRKNTENSVVVLPKGNYANDKFAEENWYQI